MGGKIFAACLIAFLSVVGLRVAYSQDVIATDTFEKEAGQAARHEEAMRLYRQNESDAALLILEELRLMNSSNPLYLYDYLAIASWSGRHDLALAAAKDLDPDSAPVYVLEALAASQRQQKAFAPALATYDLAIQRFPGRVEPQTGRINTLIDARRYNEAEAELLPLREKYPERPDLMECALLLSDARNQPMKTLLEAEALLKHNPDNSFALRMRFYALKKLGAAHLAARLTPQSVLPQTEVLAVRRDQLAFELRWARINADKLEHVQRWKEMDAVILKMSEFCGLAGNGKDASMVEQGGCGDLVVALSDRRRMPEAIALYEKMLGKQWAMPAYVHMSAAAAYLYEQQPEKARDIFASALQQDPNNLNGRIGYVYALLESEQYEDAYRQIDRLAADTNEWINPKLLDIREPNPAYASVQLTSALIRSYTDRLHEGESGLQSLAQRAPNNTEIRHALATTYNLRGWPRRAESDLELLYVSDPSDVWTKLGLFENRMAVNDFRGAEQQIKAAVQLMPEEKSVQKASREWETHNLQELEVDSRIGQSSSAGGLGVAPNGSHESLIDARLYSRPLSYDWRVFAHTQYATTSFPALTVNRAAAGVGGEYRARDLRVTAEILNIGHSGTGLALAGEYHIDDRWSINGEAENKSLSTPIRAYADNVTANNFRIGAAYRWHESRVVRLGANQMNFSDGNQRSAVDAFWTERLVTGPVYKLDSTVEYYASRNSSQSPLINYFNPVSDSYAGITFQNEWLQFNRYERSLKHVFTVGIGNYAQQNFSTGRVTNIRYEQVYRPGDRLELRYGIGMTAHPYDGMRVSEDSINFAAKWMF